MTEPEYLNRSELSQRFKVNPVELTGVLIANGIITRHARRNRKDELVLTDKGRTIAKSNGKLYSFEVNAIEHLLGGASIPEPVNKRKGPRKKAPDGYFSRNQLVGLFDVSSSQLSCMLIKRGYLTWDPNARRGGAFTLSTKGHEIGRIDPMQKSPVFNARAVQQIFDLHLVEDDAC